MESVRRTGSSIPFQYYSEVSNALGVPSDEPVVGDIVDDLTDVYSHIACGLGLYERGQIEAAMNYWSFWFRHHWGDHVTSAVRALYCHVASQRSDTVANDG